MRRNERARLEEIAQFTTNFIEGAHSRYKSDTSRAQIEYPEAGDPSGNLLTLPLRIQADQLVKQRKYDTAIKKYKEAIWVIVGEELEVPLSSQNGGGVSSEKYMKMGVHGLTPLMTCSNEIARCYMEMAKYKEALLWFDEVAVISLNIRFMQPKPTYAWFSYNILVNAYLVTKTTAWSLASDVFMRLGNTGAAVHRKWIANDVMQPLPKEYQALLKKITSMDDVTELTKLRHPDPKLTPKLELQDSELQIRGSWKKVELSKTNSIHARYSFASFVWKSRFYVCGGQKAVLGPFYLDFQYLDLKKLDRWQTLPPYPFAISKNLGVFIGFKMCVHEDKAYLFNGSTRVDYFDLIEQDWGYFDTQWVSSNGVTSFPFPQRDLVDYALAVANGKIYVFGGTHRACAIGCCLLFCLDIATRTWRLLSGAHDPLVPSYEYPGPRRHPVMWTNGKADRLYLMFGEADRPGATVARQPQGAKDGYGYDDFWSWDINAEVWRRERLAGNPPCPRSEACCTYNPILNKTILFGGYNPTLPALYLEQGAMFQFSYYADTFIYDDGLSSGSPPAWKQVITRGFPTYRAQAKLFSDPETGKVYLFGGYTNAQFVPQKKDVVMRSFNDLWQLRLDLPGGFFDGVDLEEEARTAKAGPWQRCFNCGSAGPWRKCGGTCTGKAFFCNSDCLREGWKEHKERHSCAKA